MSILDIWTSPDYTLELAFTKGRGQKRDDMHFRPLLGLFFFVVQTFAGCPHFLEPRLFQTNPERARSPFKAFATSAQSQTYYPNSAGEYSESINILFSEHIDLEYLLRELFRSRLANVVREGRSATNIL
jgi:hypothetical protein